MARIVLSFFIVLIAVQINSIEWNLTHHITSTTTLRDKLTKLESELNYKPELTVDLYQLNDNLIDTEFSYDINLKLTRFEKTGNHNDSEFKITGKLYRGWLRYSTSQTELRIGLQKINFGPAQILRSLQWFDNINPHDPTKTTEGVKAVLGRYYFINNANIWLWGIWGDSEETSINNFFYEEDNLEFGGRIQYPFQYCEAGFTYYWCELKDYKGIENRFGFDARWDFEIGFWTEISVSQKHASSNYYTARYDLPFSITLGADYTLPFGLYILAEYSKFDQNNSDFFDNTTDSKITALSFSYPIGLLDNISSIATYNYKDDKFYSSFTYQRIYDYLSIYLNIFINPENSFFSNTSIQLMLETKF